jgi:peptidoglycan/LPS O-acetylase OafA/YrhL
VGTTAFGDQVRDEARGSAAVKIPRVRALDGLRGAAVAGVLLFHGGHLMGGYLGVDLFFVLSGFLITSLLLVEADARGGVALGAFWARRARRLLPALALLMVGIALYCAVVATPTELGQIRGDALATLAYVANWRAVGATQNYWALFSSPSPLQHTWSLAIEEQFYLLWPLVFVGLLVWWQHAAAKAVLVTALVAAAVSSVLMVLLYDPANTNRSYYGTDTRGAAILLGVSLAAALAVWGPVRGRRGRVLLEGAGVTGIVVLALAWTRLSGESATLYRGGFLVCALAAIAVIAAAAHPEAGPISRALSWRPLCLLGLISYGVYLFHWPIYVVVTEGSTGTTGWLLVAIRVALTLVVAVASYLIVEQPIRHGALTAHAWRIATPAVAIALVALVLVVTTGAQSPPSFAATHPDSGKVAFRASQRHPDATRVMVVGNSTAWTLGVGLKQLRSRPPLVVLNDGVVGCAFPWGVPKVAGSESSGQARATLTRFPHCDSYWKTAVREFHPQVVLVFLQCCSSPYRFGNRVLAPCDPQYATLFRNDYDHAVSTLSSTGARVILTTAPYTLAEMSDAHGRMNLTCSDQLRMSVARQLGLQVIDLHHWTCPNELPCREQEDGVVLRPDETHFTGEGARIADRWILQQANLALPARSEASASAAG